MSGVTFHFSRGTRCVQAHQSRSVKNVSDFFNFLASKFNFSFGKYQKYGERRKRSKQQFRDAYGIDRHSHFTVLHVDYRHVHDGYLRLVYDGYLCCI